MNKPIHVQDERGERTYTNDDLPLVIGGGTDVDVQLPNAPTNERLAYIGIDQGHPFLQPAKAEQTITHNNQPVADSVWLRDGDSVVINGTNLLVEVGETALRFRILAPLAAPTLQPPSASPPESLSASPSENPPENPPDNPPDNPREDLRDTPSPRIQVSAPGLIPTPVRTPRGRWLNLTLLAVFCVLLAIAGFVFLATPVTLRIEPTPDHVTVQGTVPVFRFAGRLLVLAGSYTVHADRVGYSPLAAEVEIERGEPQVVALSLLKLPGILSITTSPIAGAEIFIDDQPIGSSPLADIEVASGNHRFRAQAQRYVPLDETVEVEGFGKRQRIELQLTPAWATVKITSTPPGATVTVAGRELGVTPVTTDLMADSYQLKVVLAGHDALTHEFVVIANQPQTLADFALQESNATVSLTSNPRGATVTVDGKYQGTAPIDLSLSPRVPHKLELAKPGFQSVSRSVSLQPAATQSLTIELAPEYGIVFVTSTPVDAQLLVDGKLIGPATRRLKLTTVTHSLEIGKVGYQSHKVEILPRAGVSQNLNVSLVPKTITNPAGSAEAKTATSMSLATGAGQELRLIVPGKFQMGASRREQGRRANENLRSVELTKPFYLGVHEVTNAQYRQFDPAHASGNSPGGGLDGSAQPVAQISWEQAAGYLNWLSERDSLPMAYTKQDNTYVLKQPVNIGYRLPTEAEWAYAARMSPDMSPNMSGAETPPNIPLKFPWGAGYPPQGKAGNYADASAGGTLVNVIGNYNDGFPVSAPAGSFTPNTFGIFDLGGNVSEWCQDFYTVYPDAGEQTVLDPVGPTAGKHRVARGSSWRHASISELRLSYRNYSNEPRQDLGFRIARYAQ